MHTSDGKIPGLLIALALLTFSLGARAQDGQEAQDEVKQQNEARERMLQAIPAPADRNALAGRFTMADTVHEITAGEVYDTLMMITRIDGAAQNRPNVDEAWEQIMLATLADSMGIEVPESTVDKRLQRSSPEIYEGIVERWANLGVSREQGEAFEIDRLRIERLKDLFLSNERTTTQDAFDQFKVNRLLYRIEYLSFEGKKHSEALKSAVATDEELESYWQSNPGIQARFRLPARISGTIVYLDPTDYSAADVERLSGEGKVTRERALAYFQANRDRLLASIPPSERQYLTISDGTKLEDIKSPFEIVRPLIEKKLSLEHLIDEAFHAALDAGLDSDLAKIAAEHNLKSLSFTDLDRRSAMDGMQRFGVAAFTQLFSAPERQMTGGIAVFEDVRFFYRVDEKKPSSIPEFSEVKDQVRDLYYELAGAEAAQAEVRSIFDELAALVAEKLKPTRERLEKEATDAAEARIAELGLTNPIDQNRERNRSLSRVRIDMDTIERESRPAIFAEILKRRGFELKSSPLFEFDMNRQDRASITDADENRLAFFRTCYQLRAMKPGEICPAPLEDHLTHEYHLARLAEVRDPALETMGPVDLIQARGQLKQISEARFPRQFEFTGLAERFGLERF